MVEKNKSLSRDKEIKKIINSEKFIERAVSTLGDAKKVGKFQNALLSIALDDNLRTCSVNSICTSALSLAELDLSLNKNRGLSYILKYGKDAEAVISYKGWLLLAKRAGVLVRTTPIYRDELDNFVFKTDGFNTTVDYKPNLTKVRKTDKKYIDENLAGILVATKENDILDYKFIQISTIIKLANCSRATNPKYSPYHTWTLEMYNAKAIKYVLSKMPISDNDSSKLFKAIEFENKQNINYINSEEYSVNDEIDEIEIQEKKIAEKRAKAKKKTVNKEDNIIDGDFTNVDDDDVLPGEDF